MILPVNLNPYAKTYQYYALPLSALTVENKEIDSFVLNDLIQVIYDDKFGFRYNTKYFTEWDCVNSKKIDAGTFNDHNVIVQKIMEGIKEGYYIDLYVNERHIPNRESYLRRDRYHDVMIHGYEDDMFYILGYCNDGKYKTTTVSFDSFKKAIDDKVDIWFFRANKDYRSTLDIPSISDSINGYILSKGVPHSDYLTPDLNIIFGVSAIEKICNELKENDFFKFNDWDFLYEHKRLMFDRISCISGYRDLEKIKNEYHDILEKTMIIRTIALKYHMEEHEQTDNTERIKARIITNTLKLLEEEKVILSKLVALL